MLLVICGNCVTAYRVLGDLRQTQTLVGKSSEYWPDKYVCTRCDKSCYGVLEGDVDPRAMDAFRIIDLTPEELFAALNGLGLPEEQKCSDEVVQKLFAEKKVKRVDGQTVFGTTRFFMNFIEFEDGTKAYLGASSHGAIVYRITKPVSYTRKVLRGD